MLFTVPSTGGFSKTILYSGFKNPYKRIQTKNFSQKILQFMARNLD
jgi:hypothetical protein